ncbi:MAG: hypothetical protein HY077_16880 [Elusimicrobia bacterium]|nr:hypothetical protein [Elusimicrobiota bacterium]
MTIRLNDPDLFGNDAAEDEDEAVFASYVVDRPELKDFTSALRRICIARAYKGEGKSALLRHAASKVQQSGSQAIVIQSSANSLGPSLKTNDSAEWIRAWKASMLKLLIPA